MCPVLYPQVDRETIELLASLNMPQLPGVVQQVCAFSSIQRNSQLVMTCLLELFDMHKFNVI